VPSARAHETLVVGHESASTRVVQCSMPPTHERASEWELSYRVAKAWTQRVRRGPGRQRARVSAPGRKPDDPVRGCDGRNGSASDLRTRGRSDLGNVELGG
jgi:hypothetical protein